jgi:8-amino-3,8-dideoxy-alpha-D-manno-octulosonate transaminase
MIVFQNKKDYLKAKAWHDHGHENNPKVPRWKDTRSGSGFNYRMSELQGAVGIAQLKKLNKIIMLQRRNAKKIIDKIKNFPGIELRDSDNNCFETFDSLIILFKNKNLAQKCRINLNKKQINTKILPEAKTWHFAKYWDHMPELTLSHKTNLKEAFKKSDQILERCVSIPISCKMSEKNIKLIVGIIKKILIK